MGLQHVGIVRSNHGLYSEHVALSALEILNGWKTYTSLKGYHLYTCKFDDRHIMNAPDDLDVWNLEVARAFGDDWINNKKSFVLKVPSVVVPMSFNYLLNPNHPDFYKKLSLNISGVSILTAVSNSLLVLQTGVSRYLCLVIQTLPVRFIFSISEGVILVISLALRSKVR